MAEKKIDVKQLKATAERLDSAVQEFSSSYTRFANSIQNYTEPCNSDFINELEKFLVVFRGTAAKNAVEATENYMEAISHLYRMWNAVDNGIADKIREGRK